VAVDGSAQSEVSVVGLGKMGSALAHAFLAQGKSVTVWNRSSHRAEALAVAGATVADSPADAFGASPLVIVCVLDEIAAEEILAADGVAEALSGRVMAQLSTMSPEAVDRQAARVSQLGGRLLAGGIMAYPRTIGLPSTAVLLSGPREAYDSHADLFSILGGASKHVGEEASAAAVLSLACWTYYYPALGAFVEAAALVGSAGLPLHALTDLAPLMADELVTGVTDAAERIEDHNFSGEQSSVDVHIDALEVIVEELGKRKLASTMMDAFLGSLYEARRQGLGHEDVAAVSKVVRREV
jgi:3-hydroxyisobutyrate dehydrogenase-like beta-hydroxyacid dehydrogenase